MADTGDSDRPSTERVEWRAAAPWFLPLPRADTSLHPMPEVVLLLDECGRIAVVSDRYPGERLQKFAFSPGATPHDVLHPDCDGKHCAFLGKWLRAWESRESELPVEWLFYSDSTDTLLRLRLQPVRYACSVLFGRAIEHFDGHSVLFVQDMSAAKRLFAARGPAADAAGADPSTLYNLRRATDPDPSLVASLDNRLRTVTSRLLMSHERERKRIARELHDGLGQSLSLLRFEIETRSSRAATSGREADGDNLERLLSLTRQALGELRSITRDLHPTAVRDHGLFGALEVLCDDFRVMCPGVELTLDLSGCPESIPDELAITAYRIAQEGLNNVAKHAQASNAILRCRRDSDGVELTIGDDGIGLSADDTTRRGLGLITMRERTEILGGSYSITSSPGKGCTVTLRWPNAVLESV